MRVKYFYPVALLFIVPALFGATDGTRGKTITLEVPDAESIDVWVPTGWSVDRLQSNPSLPPSIRVQPPGKFASLQITVYPDKFGNLASQPQVDAAVRKAAERYVPGSIEKRVRLGEFKSTAGAAAIAEFNDARYVAKPAPGHEFPLVGTGIVHLGKSLAAFTVMGDGPGDPHYVAAKDILSHGLSAHAKSDVASGKTYRR